jgi:hypothetical protein
MDLWVLAPRNWNQKVPIKLNQFRGVLALLSRDGFVLQTTTKRVQKPGQLEECMRLIQKTVLKISKKSSAIFTKSSDLCLCFRSFLRQRSDG